jgi:hypothetical protein
MSREILVLRGKVFLSICLAGLVGFLLSALPPERVMTGVLLLGAGFALGELSK